MLTDVKNYDSKNFFKRFLIFVFFLLSSSAAWSTFTATYSADKSSVTLSNCTAGNSVVNFYVVPTTVYLTDTCVATSNPNTAGVSYVNSGQLTFTAYTINPFWLNVSQAASPKYALPLLYSVTPGTGTTAGGTSVVITGESFTGATSVTFGGVPATSFTVDSATRITAITPAGVAGPVSVVVTNPSGSNWANTRFTYVGAPTIAALGTASGTTAGGTSVVITGTGFTGATSVTFGGAAATSFTVNSATQITATTPAGAAGTASVVVTTPSGSNAANTLYTYATPAPTVTSLTPNSGTTAGGTAVTITGTNFTGATGVTIGGAAATGVTVVSATSITATTPVGAAGTASVVVTTPSGSNAANTLYTYATPAPTVTSLTPNSGTTAGGTAVTITGTNFTGATGVTIGGAAATGVTVVSATSITATTPAGAAGTASVVVTTPAGSNAANTLFTYTTPAPTVTSLTPNSGTTAGGTAVTITGTNFTGATGVTIGGAAATGVTVVSATSITATTPAGAAGTASVVVTTPAGSNAANTLFTYASSPSRKTIRDAATDASVLAIHGAQIMQSQKFVTTQIENVANHLNAYRNNFNLRPSNIGFGVNLPSLGPASQILFKIKDELTPRSEMQVQNKAQSKDKQAGLKKVGYLEEQNRPPYNDSMLEEDRASEKVKQEQAELERAQQYPSNSHYEREILTYSIWTAGTIDYASYKTGDNKETQNKLTANGLTLGFDYKLHDAAIVGAAVGVGTQWQSAIAIKTNLKAKQTAVTGYGMFGFADHWVVEGLMGYGVVDFSGNRTTSDGVAQLGVNRKGETYFSSGTVSKMYWVQGYKVTPFVRQDIMHINLHSYAETGAADYALGFNSTNFMHTTTSGGFQVSRDIFFEGAKLTPTAKIALNRVRTGGLAQNIYYADTGAAGDVYTLYQSGSYMTTQSLGLGLVYTTRAGDGFDLGWQGAIGANQFKMNGLRFAVRFVM